MRKSSTSGLGPEATASDYVSFDYFMSIDIRTTLPFLEKFKAKFGADALVNTVGVAMYNAAHMAALALTRGPARSAPTGVADEARGHRLR